jgi:arylsulfatase
MDKMANEGAVFTHFYAPQAVCSASRAGLLTGCYPNRVGFHGALDHRANTGINPEEQTIAELLKTKGYATAIYGKWHLGHHEKFLPLQHGFDEFFGIPYSNDMWPKHPVNKNYYPELPLIEWNKTVETNPDQSQFTKEFTLKTLDFIKRNQAKPFFVYLAHPMPHVPLFTSKKFHGQSEQGPYGDVMMELDWSIGEINNTLDSLNLARNTLVVLTSDNGPWLSYGNHAGSSGGLRQGKGTTFEGGQRVPCIMKWKGKIPEGTIVNSLSSAIDILPTLSNLANAPLPDKKIDGVDISPLLLGDTDASPRKTFLYYYRRNNLEAVRKGNWKLVFAHRGRSYEGNLPGDNGIPGETPENIPFPKALYNLRRDPGETYNVISIYPEILQELEEVAEKAREDLGDDLKDNPGKKRRPAGSL